MPPTPPLVSVTLSEFHFEHEASVVAGRVVFKAHNAGTLDHELVLFRLPEAFSGSLDEQLRGGTRAIVEPIQAFNVRPAADAAFAVDLQPGRYGFVCLLRDIDGESHATKGMTSELSVVSSQERPR